MQQLASKYNERVVVELGKDDLTFFVMMNVKTGSWSIVAVNFVTPTVMCLLAFGDRALLKRGDDI